MKVPVRASAISTNHRLPRTRSHPGEARLYALPPPSGGMDRLRKAYGLVHVVLVALFAAALATSFCAPGVSAALWFVSASLALLRAYMDRKLGKPLFRAITMVAYAALAIACALALLGVAMPSLPSPVQGPRLPLAQRQ